MNTLGRTFTIPSLTIWLACGVLQLASGAPGSVGIDEHLTRKMPAAVSFVDEDGQAHTLQSLLGKPTVLALVYYECPGICTPLLNNLVDTLDRSELVLGKDYQVITISFRFLTGDQAAIDQITEAVGFRYMATGKDFNHPGVLTILAPDGKVMRYLYGVNFMPFDIKMAVIEASQGRPMPSINRALAFCYSYDPQGRKYVFSTLKVAGSVMVFTLGLFVIWLVISSRRYRNQVISPTRATGPGSPAGFFRPTTNALACYICGRFSPSSASAS